MKNYFLPALLWVLALSQSFAQKTLPSSLKPYSENWSYNLKRLFNHAGFDLQAAALNKVVSRSPLRLDSTKTYYDYNLPLPGDSTLLFRSNYSYPFADTKIEVNYQFENGNWQTLSRFTFINDDQQRQTDAIAEGFDAETQAFRFDSRLRIFPHGDSPELIDSVFTYWWDSTAMNWSVAFSIRNIFDAQNRLAKSVSSFDFPGDPLVFEEIYSYNNNGDNYLIEEFAVIGNDMFPSGRTEIAYSDHRPIETNVFVSDGVGFALESRNTYAYTPFGALRLTLFFEWDTAINDLGLVRWIEHKFDGVQRIASTETTTVAPDGSDERQLVTYAYIEDENLSLEMSFNWDDDLFDWVLEHKKHYYYNGLVSLQPEPGKVLALQIVPNPTVDAVRLTIENEAFVQVFNHSGQLMQSGFVQPGQMLNLVDLPAGAYHVAARQGANYYIGKVVKQ